MKSRVWLTYALVTTASWGVWGAFAGMPANHGFPETLIYAVWALTMIPPALFALRRVGWRLQHDGRSVLYGALIGLLGAFGGGIVGRLVRFEDARRHRRALEKAPDLQTNLFGEN